MSIIRVSPNIEFEEPFEPCPVCGNTKDLWVRIAEVRCYTYQAGETELEPDSDRTQLFFLVAGCPVCKAAFDLHHFNRDWTHVGLKQDEEGHFVECQESPSLSFFRINPKLHINEQSEEGRAYVTFLQIADAKTVAELPEALTRDSNEFRRFAKRKVEELKGED